MPLNSDCLVLISVSSCLGLVLVSSLNQVLVLSHSQTPNALVWSWSSVLDQVSVFFAGGLAGTHTLSYKPVHVLKHVLFKLGSTGSASVLDMLMRLKQKAPGMLLLFYLKKIRGSQDE